MSQKIKQYKDGECVLVPMVIKYAKWRDGEWNYYMCPRYVQPSDVLIPEKEICGKFFTELAETSKD